MNQVNEENTLYDKTRLYETLKSGDVIRIGGNNYTLEVADTFFTRFLGLMGRKAFPSNKALLITPCNSIHTCFMRFNMTAIFISSDMHVSKIVPNIAPWRMVFAGDTNPKTVCVLELAENEALEIKKGDCITKIKFVNNENAIKTVT